MATNQLYRRDFLKLTLCTIGTRALASYSLGMLPGTKSPTIYCPENNLRDKPMTNKILVTYASRTGYTCGVAEKISQILSENGASVDLLLMKDVNDLSSYKAVLAGSAIQDRKWLPEAMQFMQKHQATLLKKPFAAFLVCMTLAMPDSEKYRQHVTEWLNPVRKLVKPVSEGFFAGGLDIAKIPKLSDRIKFRLSVMAGIWKEGDHRDWNAIRAWAEDLKPILVDQYS
jgi:menaquinone-dependent protoporphyrinogen oxidase